MTDFLRKLKNSKNVKYLRKLQLFLINICLYNLKDLKKVKFQFVYIFTNTMLYSYWNKKNI